MSGQEESQRPIDSMLYADPSSYGGLGYSETVIAKLERRYGVKQIQAVMRLAGKAQRQAQTARS